MRPEILFPFFADLASLPRVGPRLAPKLAALVGGERLIDLLLHLPLRWIDRRLLPSIGDCLPGHVATLKGRVETIRMGHGSTPARIAIGDDQGSLDIVYFRARPQWLEKQFVVGSDVLVSGQVEEFRDTLQIVHPDHVGSPDSARSLPSVEPVYRMSTGITGKTLRNLMKEALNSIPDLPEWSDPALLAERGWPGFKQALTHLHMPHAPDPDGCEKARKRLAHDEALIREILIYRARCARATAQAMPLAATGKIDTMRAALPFVPTGAQMRAIAEVGADLARTTPMRRMVQGDVGSGKTLITAAAIVQTAASGKGVAIMSPTEILARQQVRALSRFLMPVGLSCRSLTGALKGKKRRILLEQFASGQIHALSGTHALFQDDVFLSDPALLVIDEQHRFGIADRMKFTAKAKSPHLLVMSATPIPRTLLMMIGGDMDVTILDEIPAGRKPVITRAVPVSRLDEVTEALTSALARGERAYWVCPSIDAGDDGAAIQRHEMLTGVLGASLGLVHGRMPAEAKDTALESFRTGRTPVLIATTVVEVGIDIPEASIMVIEQAERFGLAQLHQLRGRVGRGTRAAKCLLLYQPPLSPEARRRIEALRSTSDGFEIARIDYELRGAGDLLGLRQSGLPEFKVLDLAIDTDLIALARTEAPLWDGKNQALELAVEVMRPPTHTP